MRPVTRVDVGCVWMGSWDLRVGLVSIADRGAPGWCWWVQRCAPCVVQAYSCKPYTVEFGCTLYFNTLISDLILYVRLVHGAHKSCQMPRAPFDGALEYQIR